MGLLPRSLTYISEDPHNHITRISIEELGNHVLFTSAEEHDQTINDKTLVITFLGIFSSSFIQIHQDWAINDTVRRCQYKVNLSTQTYKN